MTDHCTHPCDPPNPRPRGRLGQWSDRVKALLLLSLLAVAGAVAGLGVSGAEAERVRDGLSAGGNSRTALVDAPAILSQGGREQAKPDPSGGGEPPARMLPVSPPALTLYRASAATVSTAPYDDTASPRAGHAARMPTGPPAGLSV